MVLVSLDCFKFVAQFDKYKPKFCISLLSPRKLQNSANELIREKPWISPGKWKLFFVYDKTLLPIIFPACWTLTGFHREIVEAQWWEWGCTLHFLFLSLILSKRLGQGSSVTKTLSCLVSLQLASPDWGWCVGCCSWLLLYRCDPGDTACTVPKSPGLANGTYIIIAILISRASLIFGKLLSLHLSLYIHSSTNILILL